MNNTENKQFQSEETENAKKQKQRKALLFYPAIGLLFIGIMYLIFAPSSDKEGTVESTVSGYNADMPLPTETGIIGDKKSAYELAQIELSRQEKRQTLGDYASELSTETDSVSLDIATEEKQDDKKQNSIRQSNDAYRNINRELQTFYAPSKNDVEKEQLKKKVEELESRLQASGTSDQAKQLEIMEKSYQMASRYLGSNPSSGTVRADTVVRKNTGNKERGSASAVASVRTQIVSGLAQDIPDSAFIAVLSQRRNLGFITAVGNQLQKPSSEKNTIRACVYADQTLAFGQEQDEGEQYVPLRLLEAMQAGNVVLPRNSIVSGIAKLQSGRVGLQVVSVEHNGYIIPVDLTIYDTDGQPGINAPGSAETNAIKEAAANAGGSLGTSVSFTQNAGQQVAMDLTKGIMQSGSQYLSKKIRTVKIRLKAGYQVLLLTSKE